MKKKSLSASTVMSREFDWVLFLLAVGIAVFGIINIYSATRSYGTDSSVVVQSC
jgi:cell division protein FtsW (lipid II flippase)